MNKAEELITCLEGEIAKRDARIAELEGALSWHEEQRNDAAELRAELSAIKAQEPALPKDAIIVGRSELALVRNALALDCEQGRPIRGEMLAELDASIDRLDKLYAAPVSEAKARGVYSTDPLACSGCASGCFRCRDGAKAQGVVIDADDLAQFIREIDGNHKMGAGVLAEHIAARLNAAPVQQAVPDVSAMARTLADRSADACNVNREDNWAIHGQDYIDDVTAMLAECRGLSK